MGFCVYLLCGVIKNFDIKYERPRRRKTEKSENKVSNSLQNVIAVESKAIQNDCICQNQQENRIQLNIRFDRISKQKLNKHVNLTTTIKRTLKQNRMVKLNRKAVFK